MPPALARVAAFALPLLIPIQPRPSIVSPIRLTKSVGNVLNGNVPAEVKAVQTELNLQGPKNGGPSVLLDPDGKVGKFTLAAIREFQLKQFGRQDGVIEPFNSTIVRLNELRARRLNPGRLPAASKIVELTKSMLLAVNADLLQAKFGLGMSGPKSDAMRKVNRHFAADRSSNPAGVLAELSRMYGRMSSFLAHPVGSLLGAGRFEVNFIPDLETRAVAFTTAGGIDKAGEIAIFDNCAFRMDLIHFTGFFQSEIPDEKADTLIHELAHFVGPPDGRNPVGDGDGLGAGIWIDDLVMQRVPQPQRLRIAEFYGTYARDCANRRPAGRT